MGLSAACLRYSMDRVYEVPSLLAVAVFFFLKSDELLLNSSLAHQLAFSRSTLSSSVSERPREGMGSVGGP